MVKAYLKYEYLSSLGLVNQSNSELEQVDNYIVSGANEYLCVLNKKTGEIVKKLSERREDEDESVEQVEQLVRGRVNRQWVGVGYSGGTVSVWDIQQETQVATFQAHHSHVNYLAFSQDDQYLFSGGADTCIQIHDVVQQKTLFKLEGHSNQVTWLQPVVVYSATGNEYNLLLSSGKEGVVKLWDLNIRSEVGVISTHSVEVYNCLLLTHCQVLVVFTQNVLTFYRLQVIQHETLTHYYTLLGTFNRNHYSRVMQSHFASHDNRLYLFTADNTIEVYQMLHFSQLNKKLKRKLQRNKPHNNQPINSNDQQQHKVDIIEDINQKEQEQLDRKEYEENYLKDIQNNIQYVETIHRNEKIKKMKLVNKDREMLLSLDKGIIEMKMSEKGWEDKKDWTQLGHHHQITSMHLSSDDAMCLSASKEQVKLWSMDSQHHFQLKASFPFIHTVTKVMFLPKNRFVVVTDLKGQLHLVDLNRMEVIHSTQIHNKGIQALDIHPQPSGYSGIVVATGALDQQLVFTQLTLQTQQLAFKKVHQIHQTDDILAIKYFPSGQFYAFSLLDHSIRINYSDSNKEHLSLYGHKLAAHCLDISSDNTLLVSGSNDKNIRLWNTDYGDCRKSIFAHQGAVTSVAFVKDTHYLFSAGKDKQVKYWDGDTYQQIQELSNNLETVNVVETTATGDYLLTGGMDRVIRVYRQTQQQVFAQEFHLHQVDKLQVQPHAQAIYQHNHSHKVTTSNIKYGEQIMEAFDLLRQIQLDKQNNDTSIQSRGNLFQLGGKSSEEYIISVLKGIKMNELENSLKFVHMTYIQELVGVIEVVVQKKQHLELCTRVLNYILEKDENYLVHSKATIQSLHNIQQTLRPALLQMHQQLAFNHSGLTFLKAQVHNNKQAAKFFSETKQFSFI